MACKHTFREFMECYTDERHCGTEWRQEVSVQEGDDSVIHQGNNDRGKQKEQAALKPLKMHKTLGLGPQVPKISNPVSVLLLNKLFILDFYFLAARKVLGLS